MAHLLQVHYFGASPRLSGEMKKWKFEVVETATKINGKVFSAVFNLPRGWIFRRHFRQQKFSALQNEIDGSNQYSSLSHEQLSSFIDNRNV
jgi:hypothetical protein